MRNLVLIVIITFISLTSKAQIFTERYELTPDYMQEVFCNIISSECNIIRLGDASGQYIGYSHNNSFFGWGNYTAGNGNQWIGQWNKGRCIFGILIKENEGRIGSDSHYVKYDLTKGTIMHIVKDNETFNYTAEQAIASPYRFVKLRYENGDNYIGETRNGLRHGQGIYYWANGSYWYGTFKNGYRQGYGALFNPDGTINYGLWLGDDKQ
jgi:hypothetical protein